MSEEEDVKSSEHERRLSDPSQDAFRSSFLKILDENNLLDREKIVLTPYSQLRHLQLTPKVITNRKASYRTDTTSKKFVPLSASDYFKQTEKFQKIFFNVKSLDELLEGGIDVGMITEIFGEAGSGKTQLCLQLALNCALPTELNGLNGRTCYVTTDKSFPSKRLADIAEGSKSAGDIKFLAKVYVWECYDLKGFQNFIRNLPTLLNTFENVRLVVIDSVAGIFRYETDYIKRARDMREFVHTLLTLSDTYNFAIVTTNHITSVPSSDGNSKNESSCGQAWKNLVDVKLQLERTEKYCHPSESEIIRVRTMSVIHSPRLATAKANFIIESSGVSDAT